MDHRRLTGVIQEATHFQDMGLIQEPESLWLDEILDWLNEYLPVPPFRREAFPRDAVCWFKGQAGESIQKIFQIAHLLRGQGLPVRQLQSRNPGKILYEDRYQVVVQEWKRL